MHHSGDNHHLHHHHFQVTWRISEKIGASYEAGSHWDACWPHQSMIIKMVELTRMMTMAIPKYDHDDDDDDDDEFPGAFKSWPGPRI